MTKKYMTIVIEYEGEIPLKGFGVPVLGCEVVAMALRNVVEDVSILETRLEDLEND